MGGTEGKGDGVVGKAGANDTPVAFAYNSSAGADGNSYVMKLADTARPVFVFDKAITDGTIHLSYKVKFDKSSKSNGYYYSGLTNEIIMNNASVEDQTITMDITAVNMNTNLIDTFMAGGLSGDSPWLCPGVIGNSNADATNERLSVSYDDWYKVDVIISIRENGTYFTGQGVMGGTYSNLFDAHPPFQIDGNFGVAMGIIQWILQCEDERIKILPALPDELKDGKLTGGYCKIHYQA